MTNSEKKDPDGVGLEIEAPGITKAKITMPNLPKPLTLEEKKYLLAVERGDLPNVRRMLQVAHRRRHINMNCLDPLGRGALSLAIDNENLEMVELLVVMGVETKDALLHAISVEFVEAVELLLEHEELIHKEGEPYSWEKVDWNTATFTPDITPLILAAHRNNYEIIKILLDRGATLPMPHDIKCGCEECIRDSNEDSLCHSIARINMYRALASPSLIALSSNDPILTAFQLSWELRNLAFAEQECKSQYMELRRQCQQFAVDLLDQSRSSLELAIVLNHDPENPPYEEGEPMKLARLELAIDYKQKKFVAHPNIQQLLAAIWYEGLPGFRRKTTTQKLMDISMVALLFPFYCVLYMIAPNCNTGKLMRKPFMKFLIHASSYLFFLLILILVSQRAEVQVIELFGTTSMKQNLEEQLRRQRGNAPSPLEWIVLVYVLGFILEETQEVFAEGIRSYLRNMWNFIDFTRNSLYVGVAVLRLYAYVQQNREIAVNPATAYIPREQWNDFDPQLIAEGLFAGANIFSALKLVHLFSINPHLGPLQISLGRMVIDIVKFFFIYSLVLFAFACGLNQLLWYFADLERKRCYHLPGGMPDWDSHSDSCMKWRFFGNLFESSQSLFWASFGGIGIDSFELAGIKSYTRFWGLLMFGSYSVINVIVLLNLLIAMMSNSYAIIDEHSDTEWKFARTRLWMSYFEQSATLPPPFNIFPTPKMVLKFLGLRKKDKMRRMSTKRKERQEKERDFRYSAVIRALVWRYISAMHRHAEDNPVSEDNINEVKSEVSGMKCEILEVLRRNGMDVSSADLIEKTILGRKNRIWERRLMKDFHVAPIAAEEEIDQLHEAPPENEDSLARFRRIAKLAVLNSSSHKWGQLVQGICQASQIGRCNNRESFKNQQNLRKAMDQAQKLVCRSPRPGGSPIPCVPIELPETCSTQTILELLQDTNDISEEADTKKSGGSGGMFLQVQRAQKSRNPSPANTTETPMPKIENEAKQKTTAPSIQKQTAPSVHKSRKAASSDQPFAATVTEKPKDTKGAEAPASASSVTKTTAPSQSSQSQPKAQVPTQPPSHKQTQPQNQSQGQPEVNPQGQSQVQSQSKIQPSPQTEPQGRVQPQAMTQPPLQTQTQPQIIPRPRQQVQSQPKSQTQTQPHEKQAGNSIQPADPSPLIPPRRPDGDSPPKVVKRKAPAPATEDSNTDQKSKQAASTSEPTNDKTSQSGLPPPPSQSSKASGESKSNQEPKSKAAPEAKEVKEKEKAADTQAPTKQMPTFEVTLAKSENSTNQSIYLDMSASSSTERLITSSPAPLRPIKKIDEVNTIKRQPKAGWL